MDEKPKLYLIITNISKPANIKSLLKAAVAFSAKEILIVGQKKFNFHTEYQKTDIPKILLSDDAKSRLRIKKFDYLHECVEYVHDVLKASICGVEIVDSARDLEDDPFDGDTAIMMGNEGSGMNQKQINACDYFVRIAQYGGGTASLNVNVAANIVMHRFHEWALYGSR